jgi:DNA-binding GntR family transcriptional regulator
VNKNESTTRTQPGESATTYQQQAYDLVKARIMNLDLKPGQYVTDNQIADELSISRTPVRDALRLLEHEGFLISEARRGWKVYSLSLEDIHEIFDIKVALESMITGQAAECDDEKKRAALRQAMERMKQAAAVNDHEAWRQADVELHGTLFSMCSNERAARIIQNLNEQWWRVRIGFLAMQGRIERSNPEHEAIVESILAGDNQEAERLMRIHLNNVREELVRLLVNLVLPFVQEGV